MTNYGLIGNGFENAGTSLPVIKKIVEMYGGKIWAESEPAQGSAFFFGIERKAKNEKLKANIVG